MSSFAPRTMNRRNKKGLALNPGAQPASNGQAGHVNSGHVNHENDDNALEIGVEFRLDLHADDLVVLKQLGAGNGGSVSKVQHTTTKAIMARKIIHVEAKKEIRKRIVRELGIMHECNSPYIVSFYGAFMSTSGDVVMCMEYMDTGSLDDISKNFGPVRIDVLGKIAEAVTGGLTYLYSAHRIMHRDIKPSNVLVNSKGAIKLCDFGVSSELENSVADTFVGTGTYMAPERIQGSAYTVKSDVWSVGLTLMELAIGKFPFASEDDGNDEDGGGPQGILDLLQQIVLEPSPRLPKNEAFPQILDDMITKCLSKEPEGRPTPQQLYEQDAFVQAAKRTPVDLQEWAVSLMERHNRKSHLPTNIQGLAASRSAASDSPTADDIPFHSLRINTKPQSDYPDDYQQYAPQQTRKAPAPLALSNPVQRPPFPTRTSSATRTPQVETPSTARQNMRMPPSGPLPQLPTPKTTSPTSRRINTAGLEEESGWRGYNGY